MLLSSHVFKFFVSNAAVKSTLSQSNSIVLPLKSVDLLSRTRYFTGLLYCPGTTIPDKEAMLANTQDAMERGVEVICEAAFSNYNNYCAVDILRRTETGYDFYEVKNSPAVSEQFIKDAGFQYYILTRCKVKIGRVFIVIHGSNEENPFVPVDVTSQAKGYYNWINDHIWNLSRRQKEPDEIMVEPGKQCLNPYECWYYGYCHGGELPPREENYISACEDEEG